MLVLNFGKVSPDCSGYVLKQLPPGVTLGIVNNSPNIALDQNVKNLFISDMLPVEDGIFIQGGLNIEERKIRYVRSLIESPNWWVCGSGKMAVNTDLVFVSEYSRGSHILAYDRSTGSIQWQKRLDYRAVGSLRATPLGLVVKTQNREDARWYVLNLYSGEKEAIFNKEFELEAFFTEVNLPYYSIENNDVVVANGPRQWKTELDFSPQQSSMLVEFIEGEEIILAYKQAPETTQIAALDKNTGDILWKTEIALKSNLALSATTMFFVSKDTELVALDVQTGDVSGFVYFAPKLDEVFSTYDFQNASILVASDNSRVFVYFENGTNLFSFRYQE